MKIILVQLKKGVVCLDPSTTSKALILPLKVEEVDTDSILQENPTPHIHILILISLLGNGA